MIEHAQTSLVETNMLGDTVIYCECGRSFWSPRGEYDARRKLAEHIEEMFASDRVTPQTSDAGGTAAASPPGAAGRPPLSWKRTKTTRAWCRICDWYENGAIGKHLVEQHAYGNEHPVVIEQRTILEPVKPSDGPSFTSTKVRH